jgi:hypothetical protein
MGSIKRNPTGLPFVECDPRRVTLNRGNLRRLLSTKECQGYPRFCSCRQNTVDAARVICTRHLATSILTHAQQRRADAVGRKLAHDPRLKTVKQVLSAVREALRR